MSIHKPLTAVGALLALTAGTASAQAIDYDVNYAPMHASGAVPRVAFTGPALFGHNASFGDAIRRCYGHDTTQGGRNESQDKYESTYFHWLQAFATANPTPGIDAGFVSVQAGSSSDVSRDVCISPFGQSPDNNGGHNIGGFAGSIGNIGGTAGGPFPGFWELGFQWTGSSVGNLNWLGVQANHPFQHPLLVNVIFEVQGPLNGVNNLQYYLGSTIEKAGLGAGGGSGTGGVTNGNASFGSAVYGGATADVTNAVSHTRLISNNGGTLALGPVPAFGGTAGDTELMSRLAFKSPFLWASNDGHDGAGGPDWHVGSDPVSVADVRITDTRAGAEGNFDLYWKAPGGPAGVTTSISTPTLFFNQAYLFWSTTKSSGQQRPTSWDDFGGVLPAQQGSFLLGSVNTSRQGAQTIPANFDALMQALIPVTALSLLNPFSNSEDPFIDGVVPDSTGNSHSVLWEGGLDPIISGVASLPLPLPIVGSPSASLVGAKIGIAGAGLQLDTTTGFFIFTTEIASSLEVVFQP